MNSFGFQRDGVNCITTDVKYVVNRSGEKEILVIDKIKDRIQNAWAHPLPLSGDIDVDHIMYITVLGLYDDIETTKIDNILISAVANLTTEDPDYSLLACRLEMSILHKETSASFSKTTKSHYHCWNGVIKQKVPQVHKQMYKLVMKYADYFDNIVKHERDYTFNYLGFKTLERSYLKKINDRTYDRPQYMFMRTAIQINRKTLLEGKFDEFEESYEYLSSGKVIHGTPTLINAMAPKPQLASCYLLQNQDDSITGLFNTFQQCAHISKESGGIGLGYQNVRGSNSFIKGTNGISHGPISYMRILNEICRAVDQGGKRKGAFAVYEEVWAVDIFDFLSLKMTGGDENKRCRDLFRGLWIDDLFFQRLVTGGNWSLFSSSEAPGLQNVWGDEFVKLYTQYEQTPGLPRKTVKACFLWDAIYASVSESGGPYLMSKDACNRYSNQQHLGTIQCSNLCTEVVQYTSPDEISVCFLSSIGYPRFVREDGTFDIVDFGRACMIATRHLDLIIDENSFPDTGKDLFSIVFPRDVIESTDVEILRNAVNESMKNREKYVLYCNRAEKSSMKHRNIGIGENGVADMLMMMNIAFDSDEATCFLKKLAEHRYYACVRQSVNMAMVKGKHESYPGSPASKGMLSYHLWGVRPESNELDWETLEKDQLRYGMRNSLMIAPMPTKATAHILGNNEGFEPFHSNIFKTRVLAGEFFVANKYLARELKRRGLWTRHIRDALIVERGSVQNIPDIPSDMKEKYKTAFEMSMRRIIDNAAACAPFVDQSRSMNLWSSNPTLGKFTSMMLYAWKKGLKTLMYYFHTKVDAQAFSFTANQDMTMHKGHAKDNGWSITQPTITSGSIPDTSETTMQVYESAEGAVSVCRRNNPEGCEMCSS